MIENYEILLRLVLAMFLGALLGIERLHAGKTAGIRTFALVSLASALFVIISEQLVAKYTGTRVDPARITSLIVQGVGFLGAGMIAFQKDHVANLTTAAGVWVAAAIGVAVGFGYYFESIVTFLLVMFTFTFMWNIESYLRRKFTRQENRSSLNPSHKK